MRQPPKAKGKVMPEKVFASQKIRKPAGNKFEALVSSKTKQIQKVIHDRKTLVNEYRNLNKSNKIYDKRAIEDPQVATKLLIQSKVKMPPALTKKSKKLKFFELDSDDEVLQLTHKGKNIDEIDDFKNEEFKLSSGDEGKIDAKTVNDYHFSGFYEGDRDIAPNGERKKTRQEIFSELIHKSKKAKFERQQLAMENQIKKEKLDDEFQDIRHLLVGNVRQIKEESKKKNLTDDYYSMANLLRDDTKVVPEAKVSEDPERNRERRKNAKMVQEGEEEEEDSDEKDEDEFDLDNDEEEMGDDTEIVMQKNMKKGKMNQLLKNEKNEKKRVRFVDEIRKMKKGEADESDSIGSDEEDEFEDDDGDGEDMEGEEYEDMEEGDFDEDDDDEDDDA